MTTNMGKIDRALRIVAAAALLFVALATTILGSGILFWLAVGNCPLYSIIGLKTCQEC